MKRTIFLTLFFLGVFAVYAQDIDRDDYTEITYDDFMTWLETADGNAVPERFKMYLQYDGPASPGYNFKDEGEDIIITSDTEVNFERGQEVIVYFTASGPLVWDRSIDAIETYEVSLITPSFDSYPSDSDTFVSSPVLSDTNDINEITLVPSSERQPVPGSARILVPPDTGRVVIKIDRDPDGNLWLSLEENGNPPPPSAYPPNPGASQPAANSSSPPPDVKIVPNISSLKDQKLYKLQVGAFVHKTAADDLANVLDREGFSLSHEKSGKWNRVIITGIRGSDVGAVAERLGAVGIKTIWVRE
jgi:hypothetical protein